MIFNCFKKGKSAMCTLVIAGASILPSAVLSEEVTLKSSDGTVNLVGEFIDFKDENYIIRTGLGDLRISAARVRCEGAACPKFETEGADVEFAGSEAVGVGMMPLLLSGYASYLHAEASELATSQEGQLLASFIGDDGFGDEIGKYLVTATTSNDGFAALLNNEAQIGMSSRRIHPEEARELRAAGAGNMVSPAQEHIIAVDSLVVIVHPDNPVDALSLDQVRDIFTGAITNWSEVGGEDSPIHVVTRETETGTYEVFEERIFGSADVPMVSTAVIAASSNEMAADVREDETAIGFVDYAFQRGAKALNLSNECGISMTPDAFSSKTEEYALQRRMYLYNRGDTINEPTAAFLKYVTSSEADGVIAKSGFIDLGIKRREQTLDGSRAKALLDPNVDAYEGGVMREMLAQMVNYDRLSTTFRFRPGSSSLDERGILDMARLTDYLEKQPEGTKILMVGFTDNFGAFDSNRDLSNGRAASVLDQLQGFAGDRLANVEMAAAGYGEISPSACNISEEGRAINRRVEVWIESSNTN